MASLVLKRLLRLSDIIVEPVYHLNQITIRYRYENNTRTDDVLGYLYWGTNIDTYDQVNVFVAGTKPLMEPEKLEELQDNGKKIFVEFDNAIVKPYYAERTKSIEDSVKADAVHIVETK